MVVGDFGDVNGVDGGPIEPSVVFEGRWLFHGFKNDPPTSVKVDGEEVF